ncbi:MAG: hypothetical protein MUE44_21200 [Oscillatoriaceae cyanobacterium Prado104]|nr:hypothetical protein [Oscillatoriaceae cyanobacterium Prado104]
MPYIARTYSTPNSLNADSQVPLPQPTSITVFGCRNSQTIGIISRADYRVLFCKYLSNYSV